MKSSFANRLVAVCLALGCLLSVAPSVSAASRRPTSGTTHAAHRAHVAARKTARVTFNAAMKASRQAFKSAVAADLQLFNAAVARAKADGSKTEEETARKAFDAAREAAVTAHSTSEKSARDAWQSVRDANRH
ncbi:MAG: hypothetical protein WA001_02075 [Patescibacteria group bacterium]